MTTKTATTASTTCACGAVITAAVPKPGYLAIITCDTCEAQHLLGVDEFGGHDDPVRFVPRAPMTAEQAALVHGLDDGRIVCLQLAGGYVRSAVEARPKQKSWNSPWGRYARTQQEDVDSFTLSGMTYACEGCR